MFSNMLTLKIIPKIIEKHSDFTCARIAVINLCQVDLDKS